MRRSPKKHNERQARRGGSSGGGGMRGASETGVLCTCSRAISKFFCECACNSGISFAVQPEETQSTFLQSKSLLRGFWTVFLIRCTERGAENCRLAPSLNLSEQERECGSDPCAFPTLLKKTSGHTPNEQLRKSSDTFEITEEEASTMHLNTDGRFFLCNDSYRLLQGTNNERVLQGPTRTF